MLNAVIPVCLQFAAAAVGVREGLQRYAEEIHHREKAPDRAATVSRPDTHLSVKYCYAPVIWEAYRFTLVHPSVRKSVNAINFVCTPSLLNVEDFHQTFTKEEPCYVQYWLLLH